MLRRYPGDLPPGRTRSTHGRSIRRTHRVGFPHRASPTGVSLCGATAAVIYADPRPELARGSDGRLPCATRSSRTTPKRHHGVKVMAMRWAALGLSASQGRQQRRPGEPCTSGRWFANVNRGSTSDSPPHPIGRLPSHSGPVTMVTMHRSSPVPLGSTTAVLQHVRIESPVRPSERRNRGDDWSTGTPVASSSWPETW